MFSSLGIDYGTNSVRALVVDCATGAELGSAVVDYPSGHQGVLLDKNDHHLARQNPADYLFGLERSVRAALEKASAQPGFSAGQIIGLGVDTTGSSPIPVDAANAPLALDPKWTKNLAAHCWLWKDHTSHHEAAEITRIAAAHRPRYIAKCGNTYSSEWFWSKIWRCLKVAPDVFDAAFSWVELSDYIPSVLAGVKDPRQVVRGVCCAGHKALYCDEWQGLPDPEFLALLDPKLAALRDRLFSRAYDAKTPAGNLCAEWAAKLGLPEGIPIAIGEMDVHYGAIGSGIEEGVLVKAIGTSTCDCAVVSATKKIADIPGICGIVNGAILPGFYGIEAGQSAVGDIFKWFVEVVCQGEGALHAEFSREDPLLTGLLVGQTLYTTPAEIYRALIEATAFGARAIIERIEEYGVPISRVVCCGGIAEKNALLMQIYADVTGRTMQVAGSSQACALGSAISAAVLAGKAKGGYDSFPEAQARMTSLKDVSYPPNPKNQKVYDHLYGLYHELQEAFGGREKQADLGHVMKDLIRIKQEQKPAA
jgi:L-ribulokinase